MWAHYTGRRRGICVEIDTHFPISQETTRLRSRGTSFAVRSWGCPYDLLLILRFLFPDCGAKRMNLFSFTPRSCSAPRIPSCEMEVQFSQPRSLRALQERGVQLTRFMRFAPESGDRN